MRMRVTAIPLEGDDEARGECSYVLRAHKVLPLGKVAVMSSDHQR